MMSALHIRSEFQPKTERFYARANFHESKKCWANCLPVSSLKELFYINPLSWAVWEVWPEKQKVYGVYSAAVTNHLLNMFLDNFAVDPDANFAVDTVK
jgi:hypothetical protein